MKAPDGGLIFHHSLDPSINSKIREDEIIPRNYDIVGRKRSWRKQENKWERSLYYKRSDGKKADCCEDGAKELTEMYGVHFVGIGCEDLFHCWHDSNIGLIKDYESLIKMAQKNSFGVYYSTPDEEFFEIASRHDCENLAPKEFIMKVDKSIQKKRLMYIKKAEEKRLYEKCVKEKVPKQVITI